MSSPETNTEPDKKDQFSSLGQFPKANKYAKEKKKPVNSSSQADGGCSQGPSIEDAKLKDSRCPLPNVAQMHRKKDPGKKLNNLVVPLPTSLRTRAPLGQVQRSRFEPLHARGRSFSENTKMSRQRIGAKTTAAPKMKSGSSAAQDLLSVRKYKIDDLRNEVMDLERQLLAQQQENKVLRTLYNRQLKELSKVEESKMEIPELERAHDADMRAFRTLMRKEQDKNRELEVKLRNKEDELQKRFNAIQSLKATVQLMRKMEADLEKRVAALKSRIEKRDETITMLKEKLNSTEKKLSDDRKESFSAKMEFNQLKKKHDDLKKRFEEMGVLKENAGQSYWCTGDIKDHSSNGSSNTDLEGFMQSQETTIDLEKNELLPCQEGSCNFANGFLETEGGKSTRIPASEALPSTSSSLNHDAKLAAANSESIVSHSSKTSTRRSSKRSIRTNKRHVQLAFPVSAQAEEIECNTSSNETQDEDYLNFKKTAFKSNELLKSNKKGHHVSKHR